MLVLDFEQTMKTIKERLQELPDGYRELALNNMDKEKEDKKSPWLHNSIESAFIRFNTKEWSEFRIQIYYHFYNNSNPLPPLPLTKDERQFHTYMSLPQLTMKLNNWLEYPVASLVWLDEWKTLRAFPQKKLNKWEIKSYVIYTKNPEESEVGAVLVC